MDTDIDRDTHSHPDANAVSYVDTAADVDTHSHPDANAVSYVDTGTDRNAHSHTHNQAGDANAQSVAGTHPLAARAWDRVLRMGSGGCI